MVEKFGRFLGVLLLAMIVLSFISVAVHYFFNLTWIAVQEFIIYLHAISFMLGIVYAFDADKHVRIDIFFQKFKPQTQTKINKYGTVFLLIPLFTFIFYISFSYVSDSWIRMEGSSEAGGLPFVYLLKSLLLIMPLSMVSYSLFQLSRKH